MKPLKGISIRSARLILVADDVGDVGYAADTGLFVDGMRVVAAHELRIGGRLVPRSVTAASAEVSYALATVAQSVVASRRYSIDPPTGLCEEVIVERVATETSDEAVVLDVEMRFTFDNSVGAVATALGHPRHGFIVSRDARGEGGMTVTFSAPPALDLERLVASYPLKLAPATTWRLSLEIAPVSELEY